LNTGAVRFVFKLSDGTTVEKRKFYDGDPNLSYAPIIVLGVGGVPAVHPMYLHVSEQSVELFCGFSIEEYID
jgi:hypothetical protein